MKLRPTEINASSMADIAFLMLIFFLMVTTINTEKGITVKLPPILEQQETAPKPERNVLNILTNNSDQIMVEEKIIEPEELREEVYAFITNNGADPDLSDSPQLAVISLLSRDGTTYKNYLYIHNEIRAVYNELWDTKAEELFQKKYSDLVFVQKKEVRSYYPLSLSEAEQE